MPESLSWWLIIPTLWVLWLFRDQVVRNRFARQHG